MLVVGPAVDPAEELRRLAGLLRANVDMRDRAYRFRTYKTCFVGKVCRACSALTKAAIPWPH